MERRWGFLAPWCEQLKGKLGYGRLAVKGGLWAVERHSLHVTIRRDNSTVEEEFQDKLVKIRETLALLAAVEYVDYPAWRYLLTVLCGIDVGKEGEEKFDSQIPVKFLLWLDWEGSNEGKDYDLVKFCGVKQLQSPSDEYLDALGKIVAVQSPRRRIDIQIPVHAFFSTDRTKPIDVSAQELLDIVNAQNIIREEWRDQEKKSESGLIRCTFVLEPVILDLLGVRLSSKMIQAVEQLVQNNLCVSELKRVRLELTKDLWDDDLEAMKTFGQLFNGLFNRNSPVLGPEPNHLQLEHVQLLCPASMKAADFVALASAMAVNQSVKKLELQLIPQSGAQISTRHWWTWLAYALFSKRAQASLLESVEITKIYSMPMADVEKFVDVLESDHPEEILFNDFPRGGLEDRFATLKSGAAIRWQFDFRGEPRSDCPTFSLSSSTPLVRTFLDDGASEWVYTLIPGYGQCQVQRENLEFHGSGATSSSPRISELKVEFVNERHTSVDGFPLLLSAVGSSLRSLTLQALFIDIEISTILQRCPNLLELSLGGDVVDLQLILDSNDEPPSAFDQILHWNTVAGLSRALSEGNSPFTSCVHCVRIRPANDWLTPARRPFDPAAFEIELNSLLDMLRVNTSLKVFEVIVPIRFGGYLEQFRKFHLQPTHHTLKLPLASKLAFISAISRQEEHQRTQSKSLYQLDQDVMRRIFAFSISPVLRQVFFVTQHVDLG
ncbi:hypothetical protein P3T76_005483 [Phytophthora citrophthora]|uniref:Uncharacterized protein n=1 Tax=Phytophthora citrophthora TaxID=4793 RepID=A0AAD9LNV2_9STRA|nr:hypothetical protein P3T76_005483 [Phytophthora citrophthora]